MPIGKDSIAKRVAKTDVSVEKLTPPETAPEEKIAPELVATTGVAPKKAPAKKPAGTTAKKPAGTTAAKKPAAKKPSAPKTAAPAEEKPAVETAVLSNVAPETVEAVIGHKEDEKYEKVQIGDKMPTFLM